MLNKIRYLLLQVRKPDDPMIPQEVRSFARALEADVKQFQAFDLLTAALADRDLANADVVLLGGSGEFSAAGEGAWLERALDSLRLVHGSGAPTFASCWGFQAMARAMGGVVVHDPQRAEVGTLPLTLTAAGQSDPVFGPLGIEFQGQMGHEDIVDVLPAGTTLLASSEKVRHQAYRFTDKPIYCTQFHPELNCADLLERVRRYPEYIERIAGLPPERFAEMISETPQAEKLLPRFVRQFVS